jgi:hypothetical protein
LNHGCRYGGEEAGNAAAEVLFGTTNPSGKLPITFYTGLDQLPPFASYDMREPPGRTFRFLREDPLFSFGHGLSYTTFGYSQMSVVPVGARGGRAGHGAAGGEAGHTAAATGGLGSPGAVAACSEVRVEFTVTNTGNVTGEDIAMVFLAVSPTAGAGAGAGAGTNAIVGPPRLTLGGYARTQTIDAGGSTRVAVVLPASALMVVVADRRQGWRWVPASVKVWVGGRQPTVAETVAAAAAEVVASRHMSGNGSALRLARASHKSHTNLLVASLKLEGPVCQCGERSEQ